MVSPLFPRQESIRKDEKYITLANSYMEKCISQTIYENDENTGQSGGGATL